ncbi:MAG TPA: MFS transporter [Stellaceae bacterium]|nr:MFS transporter [Stellaceae bacterium]
MGYRRGWIYALMLALVTINYMDRVALSVAAKSVATEFHLSPVQLGYLFSSFLWTYVICLLPVGILIDRFNTRVVNSVGIALWSIAIAVTGAAWSFGTLLTTRLAMGAGEATSIPSCGRIVREWMPASERGFASTIYSAGSFTGPAIGALLVGSVSAVWGWRASFVLLGALGFVWLAVNLIWFDRPERVRWLSESERKKIISERGAAPDERLDERGNVRVVLHLIKQPSLWGITLSQGCAIYSLYLLLFWLPSYLQAAKHLNIMETGLFTAIPWACAAPLSIGFGALSDRLLNHQQVLAGKRRLMVMASLLCAAVLLIVPFSYNIWLILALIAISLAGIATTLALNVALVTDLVHKPRDVGKAISMIVLGGNTFGILAPIVTGYVVQGLGAYDWAFVIAGILLVIGAVLALTMTRRVIVSADAAEGGGSPRLERA